MTAALTMLDQGAFKVTVVKNFWRRNPFDLSKYRGINITVVEKATGLQFEVQFHTPDSYIAKTREHSVYSEGRTNADPTESEIEELKRQSEAIFGQLRTPIGSVYIPEVPR